MPGTPDHTLPAPGLWVATITRTALWWCCATLLLWLGPSGQAHAESFFRYALVVSPLAVMLLAGVFRTARVRLGLVLAGSAPTPAGRLLSTLEITLTVAVAAVLAP